MKTITIILLLCFAFAFTASGAPIVYIMYGGIGGHSISAGPGASQNDGALATINQTTGALSVIGHPAGVSRISGLAFDNFGTLFAATQSPGGFPPPPGPTSVSHLITINPATGALVSDIGQITANGVGISIADLAVQPTTGILYGIRGPNDQHNGQGLLYTINKATGVATLVGDTGFFFGSIAFAPSGSLYLASASLDFATGNLINIGLRTINPLTAAILSTVATTDYFGGLGIRPSDGVIFGSTGDQHQIFTINPITGAETLVGDTGLSFAGDLDFLAVPEPATVFCTLAGIAGLALLWRRRGAC